MNPQQEPNRRLNLVVFGVDECENGVPRQERLEADQDGAASILSSLEPRISSSSTCDCFRFGKFKPNLTRPRPLLVKLSRRADVMTLLSKKGSLRSPISIKPDLPPQQRAIEKILLKERWSLIQSGTDRKDPIKISNSSLHVRRRPSSW